MHANVVYLSALNRLFASFISLPYMVRRLVYIFQLCAASVRVGNCLLYIICLISTIILWWVTIECLCFAELPDFLSEDESDHIIDLAEMFGLENSYMHSDEYQEKHKKEVKGITFIYYMSLNIIIFNSWMWKAINGL